MLSICLCSWNDLPFLKILYQGIKRNTILKHEIIVHDNGSTDGTEEWLKEVGIKYTRGETNEGSTAVNYAVANASFDYIVDINADMYPLPGWDIAIWKQARQFNQQGIEKFTVSSCLIEPLGANPEYTIANCGVSAETFDEEKLIRFYLDNFSQIKKDTIQYSHPISMPKALWNEMGGVGTEYPYGIASDHDIAARAYKAGCRNFKMLGNSRVYHFISQTVNRLPANRSDNHDVFLKKWGISIAEFRKRMNIAASYEKVEEGVL